MYGLHPHQHTVYTALDAELTQDAELVGQLPGGATFLVTDEPTCADGLIWIPITNTQLDISGYTVEGTEAEYWTEPASVDVLAENLALDFTSVADNATVEIIPAAQNFEYFYEGGNPPFIQVSFTEPIEPLRI